jgi:Uncharacterized MobA-related protein
MGNPFGIGMIIMNNSKNGISGEKKSNMKQTVELRFTKRIGQKELAVEVGIYKTTTTNPGGENQVFYGRFHVVLRKENGIWKIWWIRFIRRKYHLRKRFSGGKSNGVISHDRFQDRHTIIARCRISSRMGQSKQLLSVNDMPLLRKSALTACEVMEYKK